MRSRCMSLCVFASLGLLWWAFCIFSSVRLTIFITFIVFISCISAVIMLYLAHISHTYLCIICFQLNLFVRCHTIESTFPTKTCVDVYKFSTHLGRAVCYTEIHHELWTIINHEPKMLFSIFITMGCGRVYLWCCIFFELIFWLLINQVPLVMVETYVLPNTNNRCRSNIFWNLLFMRKCVVCVMMWSIDNSSFQIMSENLNCNQKTVGGEP